MKPELCCGFFALVCGAALAGCAGPSVIDAPVASATQWIDSLHAPEPVAPEPDPVPDWAAGIVWYQIFPERFRNGDPGNDPTRESLSDPDRVSSRWRITPWTADWYARDEWEIEQGDGFYDTVFDRRYGGDLQGIIDQLPYLKALGIGGIFLNPIFYGRSLHKYDGSSFHHIDPFFGPDPEGDLRLIANEAENPDVWSSTAADSLFFALVNHAHDLGIRVIIDGVFNHTGRDFYAFRDLLRKQEASVFADWYIVEAYDDSTTEADEFRYKGWWGSRWLPEFADTPDGSDLHPGPKEYIFEATRKWMDPNGDGDPSDGVDGWRLDVAPDVPSGFWKDWNRHVRTINPNALSVAEIWEDAGDFIREAGFSAAMNYYGFAFPTKAFLIDTSITASEFVQLLNTRRVEGEVADAMQNLIDTHDTDRLASMVVNRDGIMQAEDRFGYDSGNSPRNNPAYDVAAPDTTARLIQRLIALFQATYVGAPMIYYGTEVGMWGADDPDDRMPMVWSDMQYDARANHPDGSTSSPESVRVDSTLLFYYRDLCRLRSSSRALQRGAFSILSADDAARTVAFVRQHRDTSAIVVLNRSHERQTVRIDKHSVKETLGLPATGRKFKVSLVSNEAANAVEFVDQGEQFDVVLSAITGVVLESSAPTP